MMDLKNQCWCCKEPLPTGERKQFATIENESCDCDWNALCPGGCKHCSDHCRCAKAPASEAWEEALLVRASELASFHTLVDIVEEAREQRKAQKGA